ncbi:MAG: hypothetical protein HXX11_09745 [Desulfuromonadales bacterium]|nr:hypothetical protein [Desulfuromonadales bacterium]
MQDLQGVIEAQKNEQVQKGDINGLKERLARLEALLMNRGLLMHGLIRHVVIHNFIKKGNGHEKKNGNAHRMLCNVGFRSGI